MSIPGTRPPRIGGDGFRVVPYSGARRATADYLAAARRKHLVHALVEVDVTRARALIRAHRERTGETLSFTAFVAACLARAVDADRFVQAYRQGRRRLVVFDEVDVCVLVEHRDGDGRTVATPRVIRGAARRPYLDLHRELRQAQAAGPLRPMTAGGWLPGVAGRLFWRVLLRWPRLWKALAGTVSVSSVGMFGEGAGWGIPLSAYTLMLTVGGIATRPAFAEDGGVEPREMLSLTLSVDHDVVDGAPAARLVQRLRALLERGDGLPGDTSVPPPRAGARRRGAGPRHRTRDRGGPRRHHRGGERARPGHPLHLLATPGLTSAEGNWTSRGEAEQQRRASSSAALLFCVTPGEPTGTPRRGSENRLTNDARAHTNFREERDAGSGIPSTVQGGTA